MGCLFTFWMVSHEAQNFKNLMMPSLSRVSPVAQTFDVYGGALCGFSPDSVTPWTVARQAPSMGILHQEH